MVAPASISCIALNMRRTAAANQPRSPLFSIAGAGRAWEASELRLKSFDDLHALWFVCLKERNMLLSERLYYRQVGQAAPDGLRMGKVRTTMRLIKTVLGERARAMEAQKLDAERAERIAAVLAGTDRAAAASRISNRLSTVTVSFKRFGHKYTLPEDQLPEHPTRQQKRVAFKQKRHWDTVHSRRLALEAVEVAVGHRAPPRTPVASAAASST